MVSQNLVHQGPGRKQCYSNNYYRQLVNFCFILYQDCFTSYLLFYGQLITNEIIFISYVFAVLVYLKMDV